VPAHQALAPAGEALDHRARRWRTFHTRLCAGGRLQAGEGVGVRMIAIDLQAPARDLEIVHTGAKPRPSRPVRWGGSAGVTVSLLAWSATRARCGL
jgi:hypothetical protein